ncbi:MAG: bifunctional glutamate N-acetyltransferase/amino-acid acetyltransferase ArgJ [Haemophilus pittmaniae]|uniref:bifunctional glutamate N-acetyltransferase/amino-acid acetyltransferase ArgJ n=1 Tax=Haemophilus pittmaniae TaxID=249188 RepID=UPI0023F2FF83|nr:bifunctional glutamate N-acetyltransferase/amino-acid acetyltransferase ArgJ [Haemophilus pittmaniae]MBS6026802.1 bifunctional glutamate N-acetyltransferase/amino-acid acetyltransferase ArgJ [Haemophilus pittmaniae]
MQHNLWQQQPFCWPQGFTSDAVHAGLRYSRLDLGWLVSAVPANAAGVYTTNKVCAAPTTITKNQVQTTQQLQALIVNSGFANACTGEQGTQDVYTEQQLVADKLGIAPSLVGVASTGLIGSPLPMDKMAAGIDQLKQTDNHLITQAILTTDTKAKTLCLKLSVDGKLCTLTGFAKGSGMIHLNMATMLGFVVTDCAIDALTQQALLSELTPQTFNQITVDGDTSTNDMVLLLANGLAGNQPIDQDHPEYAKVKQAYHFMLTELAKMIAQDGEGATKLIEVNVKGAKNETQARIAAKNIVGSSLVKSAIFGADPNWGRIISSLGASQIELEPTQIDVSINQMVVVKNGAATGFNPDEVSELLKNSTIVIDVQLHSGEGQGQAWGCDLTYEYVNINASYST